MPGSKDVLVGFAKGEKNWESRLRYVERRRPGDDQEETVRVTDEVRLLDAPRTDRIAAFQAFSALIEGMKQKAEEKIREIQAAKKFIK